MANEGLQITARAKVKLSKLDENGNVIAITEKEVDLTDKEVEALCSQMQVETL